MLQRSETTIWAKERTRYRGRALRAGLMVGQGRR